MAEVGKWHNAKRVTQDRSEVCYYLPLGIHIKKFGHMIAELNDYGKMNVGGYSSDPNVWDDLKTGKKQIEAKSLYSRDTKTEIITQMLEFA